MRKTHILFALYEAIFHVTARFGVQISRIRAKCDVNVATSPTNLSAVQHASRPQIRSYDNVGELARCLYVEKGNWKLHAPKWD